MVRNNLVPLECTELTFCAPSGISRGLREWVIELGNFASAEKRSRARPPGCPSNLEEYFRRLLQKLVQRQADREPVDKRLLRRVAVAVSLPSERARPRLFCAADVPNGNPPLCQPAVQGTLAGLTAWGLHGTLGLLVVGDGAGTRPTSVSNAELQWANTYLRAENAGQVGVLHVRTESGRVHFGMDHCIPRAFAFDDVPYGLPQRREAGPQATALMWELPREIAWENQDCPMVGLLRDSLLKPLIGNSTCNGVHSPATKAHAAAIVRGRQVVAATNLRDLHYPSAVTCAEQNANYLAWQAGWNTYDGVVVYSPDHRLLEGGYSVPLVCPLCRGFLRERVREDGRMHAVSMNDHGQWEYRLLFDPEEECFLTRERMLRRGT